MIERRGTQLLFGKNVNRILLVERYGDMVVAHIYLHTVPEILQNITLSASGLRSNHNIMVMGELKDIQSVFEQAPQKPEIKPHAL